MRTLRTLHRADPLTILTGAYSSNYRSAAELGIMQLRDAVANRRWHL